MYVLCVSSVEIGLNVFIDFWKDKHNNSFQTAERNNFNSKLLFIKGVF